MNKIDLDGRSAAVTGGAQGIGRAVVERFLDSGARVAIWDFDAALADKTAKDLANRGEVTVIAADMTDYETVAAAAEETEARFGGLDILVNNAGIAGPTYSVAEYPLDEWRKVIDLDLTGVFHGCRAVVPGMVKRGYGRIVNVASIAGKEGNPMASAYSAAKSGVIALTKSLGKELAEHDIAVNCVTPAAAKTRIFDQITDEFVQYMLAKIPRGRFVKVEEIAALIAWLASEDNSFTTGGVFDISGGRATY